MDGIQGLENLDLRCSGCGECCKRLRVTLTHRDLARLRSFTSEPASRWVDWLAPDLVDMQGEPESFVELREGRRLMVLAHAQGACWFLSADQRCSVYAARPRDCRVFPYDWQREREGRVVRLALLPEPNCVLQTGPRSSLPLELAEDDERWAELRQYQDLVARWNRLASRRRRFGHRLGSAQEFIEYLEVK
ncbi:MAG TPA: YkgJ family cysteine cluster protein [Polyangiaceae bacterium]|nr:YkgJ family cysteine cluster protein [Polyangiaceae bacterium]